MYVKLLKLIGLNVLQGVAISVTLMISKSIVRKIRIDYIDKKYEEMREEHEGTKCPE